jgi:hypothetical protein
MDSTTDNRKSALANCRRNLSRLSLAPGELLGRETLALRKPFHLNRNRINGLLEFPKFVVNLF